MAAPLNALCRGDRGLRKRARMYHDRVKIWEMQGNARRVKDVSSGVVAICVWLANEDLGAAIVARADMERASGLSPVQFSRAEQMLREAISAVVQPSTRERDSSYAARRRTVPMDRETRVKWAAEVQRGAPFAGTRKRGAAATAPRDQRAADPVHEEKPVLGPVPDAAPPAPVAPRALDPAEEARKRLVSLGIPTHREGLKFEVEPIRKRGRPPAKKRSATDVEDAKLLNKLLAEGDDEAASAAFPPQRYTKRANLTKSELYWMQPFPLPLLASSMDPSAYRLPASAIWERWRERMVFLP
ncbi:hypothetical protein MSPP1_001091 [Malassezia sp. CBS 17886]|nr:hypothetical protein MSPP1_001091 [Malassezia sp. CBS 17886]